MHARRCFGGSTAVVFAIAWLAAALAGPAFAQPPSALTTPPPVSLAGTVRAADGSPVEGAAITAGDRATVLARSDAQGRFTLALPPGVHALRASHPAFAVGSLEVRAGAAGGTVEFVLSPVPRFAEDVTVAAVRADADIPMTTSEFGRREIESLNTGQEMPFLLRQVPSVNQSSDSGTTSGYSSISLRGIPQSRMNVTFDGVPLNEPEDSNFYFANFGDFANAVGSLQVQRGVGTSTVGAASFVGSINFASIDFTERPQADIRMATGSFGTSRIGAAFNSGEVAGGLRFYGQAAYQKSDGFRDHSGMTQKSLYLGALRQTDRSFFKVFGFAGQEQSQLSYLATDEATLADDLRANPMSPDERDDFAQRFLTAQYHRAIGPASEITIQGYFNGADGWYRVLDASEGLRQYGLEWQSVGATASYHVTRGAVDVLWGGHVNDFASRHSRAIAGGAQQYANRGFKNEVNSFAKIEYAAGRWHHYGDAQVRWAQFRYEGDVAIDNVSWTFFNPKVGTRYDLGRRMSLYASVGRASREPGRNDMLQGEDNPSVAYDLGAVKPERVVNAEAGFNLARPRVSVQANAFFMEFKDEIAQTGELSETYLALRQNVGRSFRRGVEVELTWRPASALTVRHSAAFNYSRIRSWTQFYDVYDADGAWVDAVSRTHADVRPLLTPAVLVNLSADYAPAPWLTAGAAWRYVGSAPLDNTGNDAFATPGFSGVDASASIDLARLVRPGAPAGPRLRIQAANLLDNRGMFPSGYSYQYFTADGGGALSPAGTRYFYPLATRSVSVMLDLRF